MTPDVRDLHIGIVERRHPSGYQGAVVDQLAPLLRERGARVDLVHAEHELHRLDRRPVWDLVVLKSGSAAALHLAAAAEAWGIPCVNRSDATRLAQDKLASTAILQHAGLPIAPARLAWLPFGAREASLDGCFSGALIVKAARGFGGIGLWAVAPGGLAAVARTLPAGPYLIMEWVPHTGNDLKVYAAGPWLTAIERRFPATTLSEKLGRPVPVPDEVAATAREAGRLLGVTCFGCDFVSGPRGWTLVDVNAFPGYKGAAGAPAALAAEITRVGAAARTLPVRTR